jgi:hypothetical protein
METGQEIEDRQLITQYLLGELEEETQAKVQDRLLCDREFFDRLAIEENELIDDYLRGALTRGRQEKFQSYFLASPVRHQKLRFAKALKRRLSESPPKTEIAVSPLWKRLLWPRELSLLRFAAGATAALIIAAGGWLALENARLRRQIDNMRAVRDEWPERARQLELQISVEKQHNQMLAEEIKRERSRSSKLERQVGILNQAREADRSETREAIISLALLPGLSREGDGSHQVEILRGTSRVRLELYPEKTDHENYRAELRTREDKRIWVGNNLKLRKTSSGDQVIVSLPATILSKGDYILTLRSTADDGEQERAGTYYFRVVR